MSAGLMERALPIRILFIVQRHGLCSPCGTGRDCLRWHIHHRLYGGGPHSNWCGLGSSFPRLQKPLLPCELCGLFSIKGGYSRGLTVLIIGPPTEDQAESGPLNHTLPVMVACQVWQVTRHIHPIVQSPGKAHKAIHVTQVHPWVSSPKTVTLLPLATTLLNYPHQVCPSHHNHISFFFHR